MHAALKLSAIALMVLAFSSCSAHPPKKVVVVDDHPKHRTYVIVHTKPARHRHCVKHRKHWHCHKK